MSLPDDINTALPIRFEDLSRAEAVAKLIRMVAFQRARNLLLIDHIAANATRDRPNMATVVTVGTGADAISILAWRDPDNSLHSVVA